MGTGRKATDGGVEAHIGRSAKAVARKVMTALELGDGKTTPLELDEQAPGLGGLKTLRATTLGIEGRSRRTIGGSAWRTSGSNHANGPVGLRDGAERVITLQRTG